jgi:hypothetical protein
MNRTFQAERRGSHFRQRKHYVKPEILQSPMMVEQWAEAYSLNVLVLNVWALSTQGVARDKAGDTE